MNGQRVSFWTVSTGRPGLGAKSPRLKLVPGGGHLCLKAFAPRSNAVRNSHFFILPTATDLETNQSSFRRCSTSSRFSSQPRRESLFLDALLQPTPQHCVKLLWHRQKCSTLLNRIFPPLLLSNTVAKDHS